MKKYITPNMKITVFSNYAETAATASSELQGDYVTALQGITDKAKVNLSDMSEIVKFTF